MIPYEDILELSAQHGLSLLGVLSAEQAQAALGQEQANVQAWQDAGYAAAMDYMLRPAENLCRLDHLLPGAQSILVFGASYCSPAERLKPAVVRSGFGRIARYAWGLDYHVVLKKRMRALVEQARLRLPAGFALRARVFTDAVPLLERVLGAACAAGFIGKNSLLLKPGCGSAFFIGELIWNLPAAVPAQTAPPLKGSCGSCIRCLESCPAHAIVQPHVVDARRCISYLTIEKRGPLSSFERRVIGDWIFGCDECQHCCPFNKSPRKAGECLEEFLPTSGSGGSLFLPSLLEMRSDVEFKRRFAGSALLRTRREGLLRNACCVLANTGCLQHLGALCRAAAEDPSGVIRGQAVSALEDLREKASGLDRRKIDQALQHH